MKEMKDKGDIKRFKSEIPRILTVDEFWKIIKNSYRKSKGDPSAQMDLLIADLKTRSIDEIYMFRDYFSHFTYMLAKDSLLYSLVEEFQVYISDDVWEYRRGHIVALGKKAYELALYDTYKFIHILKTGVYGDPKKIRHEFWGVPYNAFHEKTGLELDYMYAFASDGLDLEIKKIFKDLEKEHINRTIFEVNEYIVLKLEEGYTNLYVKGELFNQCKFLLFTIPVDEVRTYDEINSIDEAADILDRSMESFRYAYEISPEEEFWGHCSNLQVWAENRYDTRLLHSNLAFPLLKALADAGDPQARRAFKEEIAKRLESMYEPVVEFLIDGGYLRYLNKEELESIGISEIYKNYNKQKELSTLMLDSQRYLEANQLDDVVDVCNRILSIDPNNFNGLHTLGRGLNKKIGNILVFLLFHHSSSSSSSSPKSSSQSSSSIKTFTSLSFVFMRGHC